MPLYWSMLALVLPVIFWASCICGVVVVIDLGHFSAIIASDSSMFVSLLLASPSPYITHFVTVSQFLWYPVLSFLSFFPLCFSVWKVSIDVSFTQLIFSLDYEKSTTEHIKVILHLCYSVFCSYHFLLILFKSLNISAYIQFSSVQSLSRVQLFATPWIAAC